METNAIPKDIAERICNEIYSEYKGKWYTLTGMQCKGCRTFTKGDKSKMCFNKPEDYRGCNLVNKRFDSGITH